MQHFRSGEASLRVALIGSALVLGLSFVAGTYLASEAFYRVKALSNVIAVTGSAEKIVDSDTAKWTSSFSRRSGVDPQSLKVTHADLKHDLETIQAYLRGKGIKDEAVSVQPESLLQVTECQPSGSSGGCTNQLVGYDLRQSILVESQDVALVTKLALEAPAAMSDQGILFESQPPEYYVSNLANLKLEMLTEGTKNAKSRAEKIVESTGGFLGALQSAGMGVFQVTSVNSTEISDYGAYDTSSPRKKVTSIVRASFLLK